MHCIDCGGELLDGAAFCATCGQRTSTEAKAGSNAPHSIAKATTSDDAVEPGETWPSPNAISGSPTPHHDVREIIATVVLGIAVVVIAWSSYQSSLWGGEQARATTEALLQSNLSVDSYLEADGIRTSDQNQWNHYLANCFIQYEDGDFEDVDSFACDQFLGGISPEGTIETDEWFAVGDVFVFPFDGDEYYDVLYGDGDTELAEAEEFTELAGTANENSDQYQGASTILAIVLFFSGISLVIGYARLRSALLVMASLTLAATMAFLISVPVA